MSLQQIADRLAAEFPGVATSIQLGARSNRVGAICDVFVWTAVNSSGAYVADVEAAFAWLHATIDESRAGAVEIDTPTNPSAPITDSFHAVMTALHTPVPA